MAQLSAAATVVYGAHGDVGGGYDVKQPLADLALTWMVEEAQAAGLECQPPSLPPSNPVAKITSTHESFLLGFYKCFSRPASRPFMTLIPGETKLEYRN